MRAARHELEAELARLVLESCLDRYSGLEFVAQRLGFLRHIRHFFGGMANMAKTLGTLGCELVRLATKFLPPEDIDICMFIVMIYKK